MRCNFLTTSIGFAMLIASNFQAYATPTCVKEKQPFALSSDTMHWTMSIAAGEDCIQGLRWSYMQIYEVTIVDAPSKGKLIMVGPGFRYIASESDDQAPDRFTLLISGKNRHDPGASILEIEVHPETGGIHDGAKRAPKYVTENLGLSDLAE
jgi:hypothetical protein